MNILAEAHRGYRSEYPENTLLAFRKAMELPIDAFEFDVWLSADGIPVIMHDENTKRTTGIDAKLNQLSLAQIKALDAGSHKDARFAGEQVPTLEEVLALAKELRPALRLGVEIKDYREETVDKTVALLKQYGFFDGCWFYAFNARIIKYIKTAYNGRTMGYPDFQMKEFESNSYDYYDEIGLNMNLVKSELLPFYAKKGFPMHFYCADTEEDVRFCIQNGASLITANDPIPLLKVLGKL